tara:strand:+ start:15652 stop:16794 length:1143 start_codon:yes stop_codon:yes gene_type:complete
MTSYDYIIVGAGAAGLMLADALGKDSFFNNTSILLLEKDAKKSNDRTWCFWEKGVGDFDPILHKKWSQIRFTGKQINKNYAIAPYSYKMVRGLDFYTSYLKRIEKYPNITFLQEEVLNLTEVETEILVTTTAKSYKGAKIFNSIYHYKEALQQKKYPVLQQHFIGWFIKTDLPVFDEEVPTFMDFSIPQQGNTRFMYVLPTSKTEALLEYTLFSEKLLKKEAYEEAIKTYLNKNLNVLNYEIIETEKGSIPMTCYDFSKKNTDSLLYIGTAGGWSKPSTGYTFKNTSKKVTTLVDHLKREKPLTSFHKKDKFWFYDLLLLDILFKNNELGHSIFEALFKNKKPQLIFKFLDEETNLWEDIQFISGLSPLPFIKALIKRLL